jgi:hypothetical protein
MGKYEVLGLLIMLRQTGDHQHYRYTEIHQMMIEHDMSQSYTAVWRSVNVLYSDGLLDVKVEGGLLDRTLKFRAKLSRVLQTSDMKRVHNTYRKMHQGSGRPVPGATSEPGRKELLATSKRAA